MFNRVTVLIGFAVLALALAACAGGEEYGGEAYFLSDNGAPPRSTAAPGAPGQPLSSSSGGPGAPGEPGNPGPPGEPGAPAPVQGQFVTAQEGFNAIGGSATVNDAAYDLTFFKHHGVNPFIDTEDDHLSTFAIDVDTASYTVARRFLFDGNMPHPDSVRVEEFINYFDQEYEPPADDAFAIHVEGSPSPFGGEKHWMMRVGLQGKTVAEDDRQNATLIFAIDVSGSMGREDRLGLVKRSLNLLVDQLRPSDEVGIVIYGDRAPSCWNPPMAAKRSRSCKPLTG